MKAEEIKKAIFKDFIEHLKTKGIDDKQFPLDIWMAKCWEFYYSNYLNDKKLANDRNYLQNQVLNLFTAAQLEDILKAREAIEKKQKETNVLEFEEKKEH